MLGLGVARQIVADFRADATDVHRAFSGLSTRIGIVEQRLAVLERRVTGLTEGAAIRGESGLNLRANQESLLYMGFLACPTQLAYRTAGADQRARPVRNVCDCTSRKQR